MALTTSDPVGPSVVTLGVWRGNADNNVVTLASDSDGPSVVTLGASEVVTDLMWAPWNATRRAATGAEMHALRGATLNDDVNGVVNAVRCAAMSDDVIEVIERPRRQSPEVIRFEHGESDGPRAATISAKGAIARNLRKIADAKGAAAIREL